MPYYRNILSKEHPQELISVEVHPKETESDRLNQEVTKLSILPLAHLVLFPGTIIPLSLRKSKLVDLTQHASDNDSFIGAVAQRSSQTEDPYFKDLYSIGTTAKVLKVISLPDGNTTIILQGFQRFKIQKIVTERPYLIAQVQPLLSRGLNSQRQETKARIQTLRDVAHQLLKLNPEAPQELQLVLDNIYDPEFLTHFLAAHLNLEVQEKQQLLATNERKRRADLLLKHLLKDLEFAKIKHSIQHKVHKDLSKIQREQYLRHQIKILQDELGDSDFEDIDSLRARGQKKKWGAEASRQFDKLLIRASQSSPHSPDYASLHGQIELMLDLPWNLYTTDKTDLKKATKVLDQYHFGMEKVKDRILEYLAVLQLKGNLQGAILCLHGPPGVGKTSLCQSVAKALGRKYGHISLGGMSDEAEIRGHRRTYIGAMPGKIIQQIQKAKSSNPVLVLDEIDKISDQRGDPAAALLEVLDQAQNNSFVDNYLEVPYDLSKVLFITTANSLSTVPPALRDRLEVIELNGYTVEEKCTIAARHLLPKKRQACGLKAADLQIHKPTLINLITNYTRESGVRELERQLGSLTRKIVKKIVLNEHKREGITLSNTDLVTLLGSARFDQEMYQKISIPGVAIGLAWTPVGGEILFLESSLSRGSGKITLSGQLGDVMKESATTALSYLKAHAIVVGLDYRIFEQYDLHVHVPAGAVPKDGPSAGIALCTSLASRYTQRLVKSQLAMTGELTLRGQVLPVGGIQEKILAASRAGIKTILLSRKNQNDIDEIKLHYRKHLTFHYVDNMQEVLEHALCAQPAQGTKPWDITKT